jgi:hypothetical protein
MGWETRARGGRYFYRKVREGKRVRSVYVGKGDDADGPSLPRLSYPAALARVEAARSRGGDVAALVEGLNVDAVSRSLLRFKFRS